MLDYAHKKEPRKSKSNNTDPERTVSQNGSIEESVAGNLSENVAEEFPEIHTLTQEAVIEQIKRFIAPSIRQLKELTRLVQRMGITRHRSP